MAIKENIISSCEKCGAVCCRHVALELDKPSSKQDYDHIRWFLLHDKIEVFIEDNGTWNLKFETPCLKLDSKGSCAAYDTRPAICRGYPPEDNECEYEGGGLYYKYRFRTVEEFESYMDSKKKNWRFKKK